MNENRLAAEKSPYLRQHAHQAVAWFTWGEAALEAAKTQDKPIMLSIGYSTCHWCHVMARESFDDQETANLLNREFICIKVDREERPDLDKIYQMAHQMLNQRGGGWPLTVFLRPSDQTPFYAGTYFPPVPRHGLPDFKSLLCNIAELYRAERESVDDFSHELKTLLLTARGAAGSSAVTLNAQPLDEARRQLEKSFDTKSGGFSDAPKFPHPTHLERLLRHWALLRDSGREDRRALEMVTFTLEAMAKGGLNDQLGGGFYRYSVDEHWQIPHFEKMLYDNAALLWCYAAAWDACRHSTLKQAAESTAGWLLNEMRNAQGGFYSALDADSEGEEGKYYLWDSQEIRAVLGDHVYPVFAARFAVDKPANFDGRWHLYAARDIADLAAQFGQDEQTIEAILGQAKQKLQQLRAGRSRPGLDHKILAAWNGLTIRALAFAGRTLQRNDWIDAAVDAHRFVHETLWRDGRLYASAIEGEASYGGYLDDYAFTLDASIELLQTRYEDRTLQFAQQLADVLLARFANEDGGFFFTSDDHETLLLRPLSYGDEATASGCAVAALALGRLGRLLAEPRYLEAAEQTLRAAWPEICALPHGHDTLLHALQERLYPPHLVFLRGDPVKVKQWQGTLCEGFAPRRLVFAVGAGGPHLPGGAVQQPADGVVAYRCDSFACSAPIDTLAALDAELRQH